MNHEKGLISVADELKSRETLIAELGVMRLSAARAIEDLVACKRVLRMIGYPRRGTEEESLDIQGAAELVQSTFSKEFIGL